MNMIIHSSNLDNIRKQVLKTKKENPKEQIIVKAGDEEQNRKIMEIKGVDILLGSEYHERRDKIKQRDSGLNEFLCKLAKKNNIKIAIDMESLKNLEKKEKAKVLARIKQNIILCKRTKTQIILWPQGKYQKLELISFFKTLGGATD